MPGSSDSPPIGSSPPATDVRGKRPAARCLAGEHGEPSNNKVLKTEHFKGKENDKKVKLTEDAVREENKKDEEKMEPEKEPEPKVENSINVEEEESMELDLPVTSSKKKKKFVTESDSDEKNTKEKDILGERKRNSSAKKKPSPPVKDKNDDVVQDSAQGTPKIPKEKEIFQSSPKRDKNNSSPSTKIRDKFNEVCVRLVKDAIKKQHSALRDLQLQTLVRSLSVMNALHRHNLRSRLYEHQSRHTSSDTFGEEKRGILRDIVKKADPFNLQRCPVTDFAHKSSGSPFTGLSLEMMTSFLQSVKAECSLPRVGS